MDEVDFDEAVDLGDASMDAEGTSKSAGGKAKPSATDTAGRRLKGRGATGGTQTTMGDKGEFETIGSSRSGRGPAKCASPPSPPHATHARRDAS